MKNARIAVDFNTLLPITISSSQFRLLRESSPVSVVKLCFTFTLIRLVYSEKISCILDLDVKVRKRQMVCPESTEAGAMGAALQAMWCYLNQKEGQTPFEEITQQFIFLDESTRTHPQTKIVAQYKEIYQHYLELSKIMTPLFT